MSEYISDVVRIVWVLPIGGSPIACVVMVWFDSCVSGGVCLSCVDSESVPVIVDEL